MSFLCFSKIYIGKLLLLLVVMHFQCPSANVIIRFFFSWAAQRKLKSVQYSYNPAITYAMIKTAIEMVRSEGDRDDGSTRDTLIIKCTYVCMHVCMRVWWVSEGDPPKRQQQSDLCIENYTFVANTTQGLPTYLISGLRWQSQLYYIRKHTIIIY